MDLPLDRDPTATMKTGFSLSSRESGASHSNPTALATRGRTPRSRSDRAAIADPAALNLFHDLLSSIPEHLEHDRRSIVVDRGRSREDRGLL